MLEVINKQSMSNMRKRHHEKDEVCMARPAYRSSRHPKAVKVYTVSQESTYLLIRRISSVHGSYEGLIDKLKTFGDLVDHKLLPDYPKTSSEAFTNVAVVRFKRLVSARIAKKQMDDLNYMGESLHCCYAPEFESVDECREKLEMRRRAVLMRLNRDDKEAVTVTDNSEKMSKEFKEPMSNVLSQPQLNEDDHDHHPHHPNLYHSDQPNLPNNPDPLNSSDHWHHLIQTPPLHLPPPPIPQHLPTDHPTTFQTQEQLFQLDLHYQQHQHPTEHRQPQHHQRKQQTQSQQQHQLQHHRPFLPYHKQQPPPPQQQPQRHQQHQTQNHIVTNLTPQTTSITTTRTAATTSTTTTTTSIKSTMMIPRQIKHPIKITKDNVIPHTGNNLLRKQALDLRDDPQGPNLMENEEEKRKMFRTSLTGDASLDETMASIRKHVSQL